MPLPRRSRMIFALFAVVSATTGCPAPTRSEAERRERTPVQEIFVLPDGYRGPFIAIYAQRGGAVPSWRGDTAYYNVPTNGILRISLNEPGDSKTSHVFSGRPTELLGNYPTCADMRIYVRDEEPRVCWLDYSVGGSLIPNHIVAVITDWRGIPEDFTRTGLVYDSVLNAGKGNWVRKWEEPRELRQQSRPRTGA